MVEPNQFDKIREQVKAAEKKKLDELASRAKETKPCASFNKTSNSPFRMTCGANPHDGISRRF